MSRSLLLAPLRVPLARRETSGDDACPARLPASAPRAAERPDQVGHVVAGVVDRRRDGLGVRRGRAFVVVDPATVLYVSSRGGLTTAYTVDGHECWAPLTLTALADRLDSVTFLRLDPSHVVNLAQLTGLVPEAGQRYSLIFRDAKPTTLTVSRDVGRRLRAVVLDAWSRRIVGWAMATHLRTELVLTALEMALTQRRPQAVIHHSDQGCQYTALAFGQRCREARVRPSMGSVGDAYDNALCESFLATLETELLDRRSFRSQAEARMAVFEFIEGWYNPLRRHSALAYASPIEFERRHRVAA